MNETTLRRRTLRTLALAAALLLGACSTAGSGDGEPDGTPDGASPTVTTAPGGDTSDDASPDPPPFHGPDEPESAASTGTGAALLTDLRVGGHDGLDRVVLEYSNDATPGWEIGYVDEAVSDGIGEPVEVAGSTVLQVRTTGVRFPEDTDSDAFRGTEPGSVRVTAVGTAEVTEVVYDHVFEGEALTFIGLDEGERRPFRAYLLENPTRVVVEIQHTG